MKHLFKINEANINDKFTELKSKSQIEDVISEIEDLLMDIKDQFNVTDQRVNSSIEIRYRRTKNRKASISYQWYKSIESGGGDCASSDLNFLNRFLEYAELSTEAHINHTVSFSIPIKFNELKLLKDELDSSYKRSQSMGMELKFGYGSYLGQNIPVYKISDLIESIGDDLTRDPYMKKDYINAELHYSFQCPIDPLKFKSQIDFESQIPQSIISDFRDFIRKYRIPTEGKKEFINIINKSSKLE